MEFKLDELYTLNNFIGTFPNVLTTNECSQIIDFFEGQVELNNTFSRRESEDVPRMIKDDLSFSLVREAKNNNSIGITYTSFHLWKPIMLRILECYKAYSEVYSIMNTFTNIMINPALKIQKTYPSGGYHVWHCEHASVDTGARFAAYTLYLNDVEEGGETEFLYQRVRVPSQKGTLCIFPAGYTHAHRGNPPLSGVKYIMTGWLEFAS